MSPRPPRAIVYVANADSREIIVLRMDGDTGALAVVERVPVMGTVMPLAVAPNRRFLYASLRSEPFSVACFAIDGASGRLGYLSSTGLPDQMCYITIDKTGRFLLSASYQGSSLAIHAIGPDGLVQSQPIQILATRPHAHAIMTDPCNRFLFASCLGGDIVMQQKFDAAAGRISPNSPAEVGTARGAGPRHFVFHPNRRWLYLLNELDATVNVYAFDGASGLLSPLQTISAMPSRSLAKPSAADIHVTPDGRFLYASERTTSTLAAFWIDTETGRLSPRGNIPTETQPRGFAIDPSGSFLLAVGQQSHHLTLYAINRETGSLSTRERYPMGQNPNWVEIVDLNQPVTR
ncbi:MAG TPA: beta-propeller fold lactonase family protein [Stellaceae bacterium]|nr:beta-propeller fold lactonase family protein [Stellaceae bacterium]